MLAVNTKGKKRTEEIAETIKAIQKKAKEANNSMFEAGESVKVDDTSAKYTVRNNGKLITV